ncbi:MAG: hypothetical protein KAS01_00935 [Candidatus Pacebacteria bacterium]|nr:hypothetical protein [Candidatus Paceibacterota bacterium]
MDIQIIINGTKIEKDYSFISIPVFSPDSQKISYWARQSGKWIMVVEKKEGRVYDLVSNQIFSSDSRSMSYLAKDGNDIFQITETLE